MVEQVYLCFPQNVVITWFSIAEKQLLGVHYTNYDHHPCSSPCPPPQILQQVWPFVGQYLEKLLVETIAPSIRSSSIHLQTLTFTKVDFGDKVTCKISFHHKTHCLQVSSYGYTVTLFKHCTRFNFTLTEVNMTLQTYWSMTFYNFKIVIWQRVLYLVHIMFCI